MLLASSILGTLPGWLTLAALLFTLRVLSRGGAGSAVSELSKANEVLTQRVHELGDEVRDLRIENAELRSRTDFATALAPILEWTANHEIRAQERHELYNHEAEQRTTAITSLLGQIGERLERAA